MYNNQFNNKNMNEKFWINDYTILWENNNLFNFYPKKNMTKN